MVDMSELLKNFFEEIFDVDALSEEMKDIPSENMEEYMIDLFREDIPPTYVLDYPKTHASCLETLTDEELDEFVCWIFGQF